MITANGDPVPQMGIGTLSSLAARQAMQSQQPGIYNPILDRLAGIEAKLDELLRRMSVWDQAAMANTLTTEEVMEREGLAIMKAIREAAR